MNTPIYDYDSIRTLGPLEFTPKALRDMNAVVDSSTFCSMDTRSIFHYLSEQMTIISFGDQLKRYIYQKAEISRPFSEISENIYMDIIMQSFQANSAPRSFEPTTTHWRTTVRSWLQASNVRRSTIFLLGFGLRMTQSEVSSFLTKVIREEDFNFSDEAECVYWHCFLKGKPYREAIELLAAGACANPVSNDKLWEAMYNNPRAYLGEKENLITYLSFLHMHQVKNGNQERAYKSFVQLYQKSREIIAGIYFQGKHVSYTKYGLSLEEKDITPADVERMLCCGIPKSGNGNLEKITSSALSRQFSQKRMSRHRLYRLLERKREVERFDLITLLFFIYAETVEKNWPSERYRQFIDRSNEVLTDAGMMGIYPVNPYEAFVLMCLLTDEPLATYAEVWEMSYTENGRIS